MNTPMNQAALESLKLPPRLERFGQRLLENQINAIGTVDIMWREEMLPLVVALESTTLALIHGEKAVSAIAYARDVLERLQRTP